MAFSVSDACVPVAFFAALSGRLARHRRRCVYHFERYHLALATISGQSFCLLAAGFLWGSRTHAVALD